MSNVKIERIPWVIASCMVLLAGYLWGQYSISQKYENAWTTWSADASNIVFQATMPTEVLEVNHVQNSVAHLAKDNPEASEISAYPIEIFQGIAGNTHLRIKLCAEYTDVPSLNQCVESMIGSGDYWYKWYNLRYPPMPPVYK